MDRLIYTAPIIIDKVSDAPQLASSHFLEIISLLLSPQLSNISSVERL